MSASVEGPPGAALPSPPGFPSETFRANLYVHHADGSVEWYALLPASFARGPLVLGRDADCAINIEDGATSGRHACIEARGPALWLTDLGSTNGTLLDESRLRPDRPIRLDDGAVIGVGDADVRFLYSRRDNPIRLVAEFIEGPLAGTRQVTAGPSTTIGRAAELVLDGPGVAPNHLRIDAYDAEHIYTVPLSTEGRTWIFQSPLDGVAAIPGGAELTIGAHRFRLRVEAAPESTPASAAPPRVDAAMLEARLLGQDPRAYDKRTIMDLSPLGAMVAKVLAGEVPPPPSAVRPPVRRPTNVHTVVDDRGLELARRTGPVPILRPVTPRWIRIAAGALVLATVVAVVGLIPVPREVEVTVPLRPGPTVVVRAPVAGTLLSATGEAGQVVRGRQPLARLADEAIAGELDRLSRRIGALEVYVGDGRVGASAVRKAKAELAEAEAAFEARSAPGATFDADGLIEARRVVNELRGRFEALEARRADRSAGPDAPAKAIGPLVHRRAELTGRLIITLEAPGVGLVHTAPDARPGAAVPAGQPLYRLVPRDPLYIHLDPRAAGVDWLTGPSQVASATLGGQRIDVTLRPGADGHYRAPVASPGGVPAAGTPAVLRLEGPPRNVLQWTVDRLGLD